jgi:hypothetical protein
MKPVIPHDWPGQGPQLAGSKQYFPSPIKQYLHANSRLNIAIGFLFDP